MDSHTESVIEMLSEQVTRLETRLRTVEHRLRILEEEEEQRNPPLPWCDPAVFVDPFADEPEEVTA